MIIILDNIRSVENVGSIFRTADAFGVEKIYLCGITPSPIDRFGRQRNDLHKTALGAEDFVEWEYKEDVIELVKELKSEYEVVSVEQDEKSVDYRMVNREQGVVSREEAFVFGSEVNGVKKEVLELSDKIIEIPMKGQKESLNVAVTVGIILSNM
jgi:23S rRNA (guanosine2251-2'-O)-methyltransferase